MEDLNANRKNNCHEAKRSKRMKANTELIQVLGTMKLHGFFKGRNCDWLGTV